MELNRISNTLVEQEKSIVHNNEMNQSLEQEINGTRILIEEIINIMNISSEKLNSKKEQIQNTKEKMTKLRDKTSPILNNIKILLNEMKLDDLNELK